MYFVYYVGSTYCFVVPAVWGGEPPGECGGTGSISFGCEGQGPDPHSAMQVLPGNHQ